MSAPTGTEELFDAEFLGRLRALFFKLRKRRMLRKQGQQASPAVGHTREFKDHRSYAHGDDYRQIDWRLYARLEKLFIRIFEEIQEFHVHILFDRSASMAEPYPEKRVLALRLAVALAYLGLVSQHRVSILSLGETIRRETPPRKGQGHIHEILSQLAALPFAGQTDLGATLRTFRPARDRRGIVFVISDLLGRRIEDAEETIQALGSWSVETHVIHILHPEEGRPRLDGEVELSDIETGERRRMWLTKRDLERYQQRFEAYTEGLEHACLTRRINYMRWSTEHTFEELFLDLLARGSALADG